MVADAGHPRPRRPPGVGRRRHRRVRDGRLPAHRRHARAPDAGAHQPRRALADLRVPHPHVADPPRRAAALRLRSRCPTTSGASPPTRFREAWAEQDLRTGLERPAPSPSSTTTGPRAGPGLRVHGARGARIGYWDDGAPRARSAWSGGATAAGTSRSSPRRRAPSPTKRVAFRCHLRAPRVGYPGVAFLPDLQEYRTPYRRLRPGGERLRAPRARLRGAATPARPGADPGRTASWPPACSSA